MPDCGFNLHFHTAIKDRCIPCVWFSLWFPHENSPIIGAKLIFVNVWIDEFNQLKNSTGIDPIKNWRFSLVQVRVRCWGDAEMHVKFSITPLTWFSTCPGKQSLNGIRWLRDVARLPGGGPSCWPGPGPAFASLGLLPARKARPSWAPDLFCSQGSTLQYTQNTFWLKRKQEQPLVDLKILMAFSLQWPQWNIMHFWWIYAKTNSNLYSVKT